MGELLAGLAHDINRPLHSIANFAAACERSMASKDAATDEFGEWIREIKTSDQHAREIIRLREFVAPTETERIRQDLNEAVRDGVELVSPIARSEENRNRCRAGVEQCIRSGQFRSNRAW